MTALPLPDRHNGSLSLSDFEFAVSSLAILDRRQSDVPLAPHRDVFPIAGQREAGEIPVNRQIGEFIHPYRSHILHPAYRVTKRTQRVNAGQYPKLTSRSFGEKS